MALDGIGFALGAIPELRQQVISVQKRISKFVEGPATFRGLSAKFDAMTADVQEIGAIIRTQPSLVPEVSSAMFRRRLETVQTCLKKSENALDELSKDAFPGSSSGKRKKMKLMFKRVLRADSIAVTMSCEAEQVGEAASELRGLVSTLTMLVKVESINMNQSEVRPEPNYKPDGSTPALTPTVSLDYSSRDVHGAFVTPEGELKHYVLNSVSSAAVTAAAGVVGMAGVGKTIALQGLAQEEDIQTRFPHGIHYISLGHSATLQDVITEVGKIMRVTGAAGIVDKVEKSASLREAVDYAVMWFRGKECLFLIDDLWPTADRNTGYLDDLRQLLRGSPKSRMAITTRSHDIALAAGSIVDFAARDPQGPVSERLFMSFATRSLHSEQSSARARARTSSVHKILAICGGLPIALSVTGCAVAFLASGYQDFESACDAYADELENTKTSIGDKKGPGGTSLNAGILLSLKYLDAEFEEWKKDNAPEMICTVTYFYTGLCVLQNQAWIPVSVLCRLWNADVDCALYVLNRICAMSLATFHCRKLTHGRATEAGLILHDLHLEFCQRQAQRTRRTPFWHRQLLNGYLSASSFSGATAAPFPAKAILNEENILKFSPRPWWSARIPEDGYIHANLTRHLVWSNQALELNALLLDARWTHVRLRIGGILALRVDFWTLGISTRHCLDSKIRESFGLVLKALQLSWGSAVHGERALLFQVCGRLHGLRKTNPIVLAFLKSIENSTARPYLLPMNQFAGTLHRSQLMEFQTKAPCLAVACSPCGRFIAAGGSADVFVVDATSGLVVTKLQGHFREVTVISFSGDSEKLVSGSKDAKVLVWNWQKRDRPVQSMEGHTESISCLAVTSDGKRIISGSVDRTLRIWDIETGGEISMYLQRSSVCSICVFADGRRVAIGLHGGDLKVLDITTEALIFERIQAHKGDFVRASLSPDENTLVTACDGDLIQGWETRTWKAQRIFQHQWCPTRKIVFSPDGKKIASASRDGRIRVEDVSSSGSVAASPDLESPVASVEFTRNGKHIVCALASGTVQVWDISFAGTHSEEEIRHKNTVSHVDISPDGHHVASVSYDGETMFWTAETGSQAHIRMAYVAAGCISFSPTGRNLVLSHGRVIQLWDPTDCFLSKPLRGHTGPVTCASITLDGLRVVSGSTDKTVRVWDVQSCRQIGDPLEGPECAILEASESSDGRYFVSKSRDGETFIWNCRSRDIAWTSKKTETEKAGYLSDEDAAIVIRSCGKWAPHLWPECSPKFPEYTSEVYFIGDTLYSSATHRTNVLGVWAPISVWKYDSKIKLFAAGMKNGGIAICKFVS